MKKNGTVSVESEYWRGEGVAPGPDPRVAGLEDRVRRLEDVVASLQDTRGLEDRVVENLTARITQVRPSGLRESAGLIIDAGRQLLPAAVDALKHGADAADVQAGVQARTTPATKSPWLLFEVYADLRAMVRMYVDPRYALGWQGRLLPLILVAAILLSWLWLPGSALLGSLSGALGTLYMKIVDLALAFVLCKVIHREVRRYRETSPDLPPSLRL